MTDPKRWRPCGAKTRAGTPCQRPRGWGTDHPDSGRCKLHGGSSPSGRKHATREAALEFAVGALGAEVLASPLDAIEQSVRLAAGIVSYYRHELAAAASAHDGPDMARIAELAGPYSEAIKLQKDVAKAALDAGVAERGQQLAEEQAEVIAAAITDGLREAFGALATPERRTLFAKVVTQRLLVLEHEDEPLALSGARAKPAGGD